MTRRRQEFEIIAMYQQSAALASRAATQLRIKLVTDGVEMTDAQRDQLTRDIRSQQFEAQDFYNEARGWMGV